MTLTKGLIKADMIAAFSVRIDTLKKIQDVLDEWYEQI